MNISALVRQSLLAIAFSCFSLLLQAQSFKAAVSKVDFTPDNSQRLLGFGPRESTGVHDRIYHRVTVMDDGKTRFVLVSSDICMIAPTEYDKVAERLQKELGISPENFWWSVTHTHAAPELGPLGLPEAFRDKPNTHQYDTKYIEATESKLVNAVADAIRKLEPARLSAGWGESHANVNRRARDGKGGTFLGQNPDLPVDRRIGMLRLDKLDGSPICLIANYAMHATVLGGQCMLISGDAPGIVAEYVEKKAGAPMLFINGAAGNIAPIYSTQPDFSRLKDFESLLGDRILEANSKMTASLAKVKLKAGGKVVEIPQREMKWPEYMRNYTGKNRSGTDVVKLPVRFLTINKEIAIWSAPLELFCEISNEVRDRSPYRYTFYYGYTNGWLGYLLTDEEIPYGGYETTVTPFKPGAGQLLIEAVLNHIRSEKRKL